MNKSLIEEDIDIVRLLHGAANVQRMSDGKFNFIGDTFTRAANEIERLRAAIAKASESPADESDRRGSPASEQGA
jgi:plasmid stabilization system protein ParE